MRKGYTFNDVLIEPRYSDIDTRASIDVTSHYLGKPRLPIISAPMDYVTGFKMAEILSDLGAYGIVSRFGDAGDIDLSRRFDYGVATGTKDIDTNIRNLQSILRLGEDFREFIGGEFAFHSLCIDVAHGHHKNVIDGIKKIKDAIPDLYVIAGNVATQEGFADLADAGADAIRVGIGAGSVCSTRENTGVGIPQLSAIESCYNVKALFYPTVTLIADGGIQNPGDIAKALAAGADAVMLGKMLAGHDESPGDILELGIGRYKKYRGQSLLGTNGQRNAPEGVEGLVEYKGPVKGTIDSLMHYLRSSMSYVGARNLTEFRKYAEFIRVSPSTLQESNTRI